MFSIKYKCLKCGKCCRDLGQDIELLTEDKIVIKVVNGICQHLDLKTNLCKIDDKKPKVCRVWFCEKARTNQKINKVKIS